MANAEVGDDVLCEDPTVNRLEKVGAELLGKEAALFVASGTMANQVSVRAQTQPGDEIIVERHAHVFGAEAGGLAALSGVQVSLVDGDRGVMTCDQVQQSVRRENIHFPTTTLICLENTHNSGGGRVYPLSVIDAIREFACAAGIRMHLDGARLLNASVASGIAAQDVAARFDSCTLCLSKGLGAPVGSLLAGSQDFIVRARRFRKMYGGGMRQAGVIAAAGLYALEHNVDRLVEDHSNARMFADSIVDVPGVVVTPAHVETNIVYFDVVAENWSATQMVTALRGEGILVLATGDRTIRAVTHLDVSREQVQQAAAVVVRLLAQ